MLTPTTRLIGFIVTITSAVSTVHAVEPAPSTAKIRAAVRRALPMLEVGSAGTAAKRKCFTCHGQAMPVLAIVAAKSRGFNIDAENLDRQIEHAHHHLRTSKKKYEDGRGTGGGVDTAGYALWALEDGAREADEFTLAVTNWLLAKQTEDGHWQHSSNRPPSEASDFTTTYVALRALAAFGTDGQREKIEKANKAVTRWLIESQAKDTEDRVFRLLTFHYVEGHGDARKRAINDLVESQQDDGGWAQLADMKSDAYATATSLYALLESGASANHDDVRQRGLRFLLNDQQEDGTWYVKSRSRPFQTYFETGFPHGEDQFISTTATAWATIVLSQSLPRTKPPKIETLGGTKTRDDARNPAIVDEVDSHQAFDNRQGPARLD